MQGLLGKPNYKEIDQTNVFNLRLQVGDMNKHCVQQCVDNLETQLSDQEKDCLSHCNSKITDFFKLTSQMIKEKTVEW